MGGGKQAGGTDWYLYNAWETPSRHATEGQTEAERVSERSRSGTRRGHRYRRSETCPHAIGMSSGRSDDWGDARGGRRQGGRERLVSLSVSRALGGVNASLVLSASYIRARAAARMPLAAITR